MDTVEGLRDAARRARECAVIGRADWHCKITLEKTVPRDGGKQYPVCAAFQGDSPVEYWDEERPGKPTPFGLNKVNRRLAALGREVA